MVASYTFRFRRSDVGLRNEWFNYTNWKYDKINPVKLIKTNGGGCLIPEEFNFQEMDSSVEHYERMILKNMGIMLGAEYRENILDANVDAHLLQYNIDDNLSFQPFIDFNNPDYNYNLGLEFKLNF